MLFRAITNEAYRRDLLDDHGLGNDVENALQRRENRYTQDLLGFAEILRAMGDDQAADEYESFAARIEALQAHAK